MGKIEQNISEGSPLILDCEKRFSLSPSEISQLMNMVYNMAVGMLHNHADADDAVQEIMEIVFTRYSSFRHQSKLSTWVYRIARNHLIQFSRKKSFGDISFELFERDVNFFTPYNNELGLNPEEEKIYVEQVKEGCTLALLQCLDPENRFIFIIGTVFNIPGCQGAKICELRDEAYRQRLSRAKRKITNFMTDNCGLINPQATCSCHRRILVAYGNGRIQKEVNPHLNKRIGECTGNMNEIDSIAAVYRDNSFFDRTEELLHHIVTEFPLLFEKQPVSKDQ